MSGSYPHHISRPLVIFNLFTTFYYYFLQVCDYWRKSGDLVCQDCSRSLNKNWKRGQTKKKKRKGNWNWSTLNPESKLRHTGIQLCLLSYLQISSVPCSLFPSCLALGLSRLLLFRESPINFPHRQNHLLPRREQKVFFVKDTIVC